MSFDQNPPKIISLLIGYTPAQRQFYSANSSLVEVYRLAKRDQGKHGSSTDKQPNNDFPY